MPKLFANNEQNHPFFFPFCLSDIFEVPDNLQPDSPKPEVLLIEIFFRIDVNPTFFRAKNYFFYNVIFAFALKFGNKCIESTAFHQM